VIILDVNILIYAVNQDAPLHSRVSSWLEERLSGGTETTGIPWTVLLAFLRLTTRAGLFRNPMPLNISFDLIDGWLEQPTVLVIEPGPRHGAILRALLAAVGTAGNLTSDAHLAALAIEYGAELCSCDRDFDRFPGLRWRNPLA
jgi:toxin-antitoxin system PIN domain toxin